MKKLIITALLSILTLNIFANAAEVNENERLCKVFSSKIDTYKSTMRKDSLADATLLSYEKRASKYCNPTAEKVEVKAKVAVKAPISYGKKDARLCTIFTKKVAHYEAEMRSDDLAKATLDSYKHRMNSFCKGSSVKS